MAIDLGNTDSRKSYLKDKLDDLLEGIHESYTSVLMDELIARLERTVNDFNDEVKELMELLKARSDKKEHILEKLKSGKVGETTETEQEQEPEREMSVWERKLEAMDKPKRET
ncbi:MAG: hypothetical protein ACE5HZ_01385 [Fidelibacterota bacterium]